MKPRSATVEQRTLEVHVKARLQEVLTKPGRMPFSREFKADAPGLWDDAAKIALRAIQEWEAAQSQLNSGKWMCPIDHAGCNRFCGNYGCGG